MDLSRLNSQEEPVRLGGWTALTVGLALNAVVSWAFSADLRVIVGSTAALALTVIGGLEWARSHAYSPATHHTEVNQARNSADR